MWGLDKSQPHKGTGSSDSIMMHSRHQRCTLSNRTNSDAEVTRGHMQLNKQNLGAASKPEVSEQNGSWLGSKSHPAVARGMRASNARGVEMDADECYGPEPHLLVLPSVGYQEVCV